MIKSRNFLFVKVVLISSCFKCKFGMEITRLIWKVSSTKVTLIKTKVCFNRTTLRERTKKSIFLHLYTKGFIWVSIIRQGIKVF